jgi:hypothetical protein
MVWGIDYVINRIDTELHRADFESQLLASLEAVERKAGAGIGEDIDRTIDRRFRGLAACIGGDCEGQAR